jgi:hypothetical protein
MAHSPSSHPMTFESLFMNIPSILGALVPVVAIVCGIGIGMLGMYFEFRRKREIIQLHHAERMAAIEKGIELPPLPQDYYDGTRGRRSSTPAGMRRKGFILLFAGIALTVGLWGSGGARHGSFWWGLLPAAIGAAYLLTAFFDTRDLRRSGDWRQQSGLPPDSNPR